MANGNPDQKKKENRRPNGDARHAPAPEQGDDVTYQPESGVPVPDESQLPHRDRPSEEDI
jgi:hypothetical protein